MKRRIISLMIVMLLLSCNLFAQKPGKKYYITGQVIDINDKPVSGAIVLIDNHNTEVVTNAKGMYKVRVKTDATMITVLKPNNGQLSISGLLGKSRFRQLRIRKNLIMRK
jgi:hypothetical protein